MDRLLYVPILHTEKEIGLIQGEAKCLKTISSIKEMWVGIQNKILNLRPNWDQVRIYQEALPVCGKEEKIVQNLSLKGSMNHRMVSGFLRRGASLEGTEDSNLLIREHDLLSQALHSKDQGGDLKNYRKESDAILELRDQFIAQRIKQTLQKGETGLLFIGVRHKVDQLLKKDYYMTYIIYRIPFDTVKTVYNL